MYINEEQIRLLIIGEPLHAIFNSLENRYHLDISIQLIYNIFQGLSSDFLIFDYDSFHINYLSISFNLIMTQNSTLLLIISISVFHFNL